MGRSRRERRNHRARRDRRNGRNGRDRRNRSEVGRNLDVLVVGGIVGVLLVRGGILVVSLVRGIEHGEGMALEPVDDAMGRRANGAAEAEGEDELGEEEIHRGS